MVIGDGDPAWWRLVMVMVIGDGDPAWWRLVLVIGDGVEEDGRAGRSKVKV